MPGRAAPFQLARPLSPALALYDPAQEQHDPGRWQSTTGEGGARVKRGGLPAVLAATDSEPATRGRSEGVGPWLWPAPQRGQRSASGWKCRSSRARLRSSPGRAAMEKSVQTSYETAPALYMSQKSLTRVRFWPLLAPTQKTTAVSLTPTAAQRQTHETVGQGLALSRGR